MQAQLMELNTIPPELPAFQAAHMLVGSLARQEEESNTGRLFLDGYIMALIFWLRTEGFGQVAKNIGDKYDELREAHATQI